MLEEKETLENGDPEQWLVHTLYAFLPIILVDSISYSPSISRTIKYLVKVTSDSYHSLTFA